MRGMYTRDHVALKGRGAIFCVGDLAVAHVEDAVGDLGGFGVVGDHEDGLVEVLGGGAEHFEDGVGVFGV